MMLLTVGTAERRDEGAPNDGIIKKTANNHNEMIM